MLPKFFLCAAAFLFCHVSQAQIPDIPVGTIKVKPKLHTSGVPISTLVSPFFQQNVGPTDFAAVPGTTMSVVTAIGGRVDLLDSNGTKGTAPFLNLSDPMSPSFSANFELGEASGLSTIAFHPDFANSNAPGFKRFYTIESEFAGTATPDFDGSVNSTKTGSHHDEALYEYTLTNAADLSCDATCFGSRREVLRVLQPGWHHNFGDIAFDSNGDLFIGSGDGSTHTSNPYMSDNSQDLTTVFGNILRIDPLGTSAPNGQYSIPATNPFIDGAGGNVDEIYAYGFRNPYRINFDSLTGDLWASETGELSIESADRVQLGSNHGWNLKEGSFLYDKVSRTISIDVDANGNGVGDFAEANNLTEPVFEYDHDNGYRAIVGGVLYRGSLIPELQGHYIFADIVAGKVFYGDPATGDEFEFLIDANSDALPGQIHSINEDANGEIYVLGRFSDGMGNFDGWVVRLGASAGDFDASGDWGCADINALSLEISVGSNNTSYDLTGDGLVNGDDLDQWLIIAGDNEIGPGRSYLKGDANLDGVVDAIDFSIWSMNRFTANTDWCAGNFNANSVIDSVDFSIWSTNRFQSSVPEPSVASLTLIALCLTWVGRHPAAGI